MTGIERLRDMAQDYVKNSWSEPGKMRGRLMLDIADQIEREMAPKTDTSPAADEQNPSWHDPDNAADVTSDAQKVTREDTEAIAWVREHGGLDEVREEWKRRCNLKRMCEKEKAKVERQQRHIEFAQRKCHERLERIAALSKTVAEMRPRLMPEGMEWPRFEDGEPVRIGDEFEASCGIRGAVDAVIVYGDGFELGSDGYKYEYDYGERVKRPAKVLDADGVDTSVGDTVYDVDTGEKMWVCALPEQGAYQCVKLRLANGMFKTLDPCRFTHRAPVLAADGRPLREGETVYHVADGRACVVREVREDGVVVEPVDGRPRGRCRADYLTHERPDSYDALWEDIENCAVGYEGFMRRVKALAERGK